MTTRVFGDNSGFKAGGTLPKPTGPMRQQSSPMKVVVLIVLGLALAFLIAQKLGMI